MEKYNIQWTDVAKNDLHEIIEYIALDSRNQAKKQYEKIKSAASDLTDFPNQGRFIPELKINNITKYREIIISPWRIFYKVEQVTVYIIAIIDGRRNIEDILLARNLR